MAAELNIDAYLEALRRELRGHHDREALLAEVEDHLRSAVECRIAAGAHPRTAEDETIRTFGESDLIADALLAINGSPAVPTRFTRDMGVTAVVGSGAWLALATSFWTSHVLERRGHDWEGSPRTFFLLGMAALAASAVVTFLLMLALRERQGGFGLVPMLGIGVGGLAGAASLVAWAIPLWTSLFALACLPVAITTIRHGAAPTGWSVLFAASWPVGLATLAVLRAQEFGTRDEWGDYPVANLTGMSVGCTGMFLAFLGLGRWLRSEEPFDDGPDGVVAA